MGSVSNFVLRHLLINSQRRITSQKCIAPTIRVFRNFTKINLEAKNVNNVKQLSVPKPSIVATCRKFSETQVAAQKQRDVKDNETSETEVKLSKWQQLKKMYKEYWYIVVPVHLVTSAGWFGGFYYIASSGIDIVSYLEYFGASEFLIKPLRDSTMGYFAVAYALYKIFTPLRYTVTLGGTTISIKVLKNRGYIKPVPSKTEIKEIYQQKKGEIQESLRETKKGLQQRKQNITEDIAHYRKELKSLNQTKVKEIEPKPKL